MICTINECKNSAASGRMIGPQCVYLNFWPDGNRLAFARKRFFINMGSQLVIVGPLGGSETVPLIALLIALLVNPASASGENASTFAEIGRERVR